MSIDKDEISVAIDRQVATRFAKAVAATILRSNRGHALIGLRASKVDAEQKKRIMAAYDRIADQLHRQSTSRSIRLNLPPAAAQSAITPEGTASGQQEIP